MLSNFQILKRLYKDYTKYYIKRISLSIFFTILLAGSTSSVAYLLDPAIKQLFVDQNQGLIYVIPGLIILFTSFNALAAIDPAILVFSNASL